MALDVDGTLLTSQGTIAHRTRRAIQAAQERGVLVVLATGRPRSGALKIAADLGGDAMLMVNQGAALWRREDLLFHRPLSAVAARRAVEVARAHSCVTMVFPHATLTNAIWIDGEWATHPRVSRYVTRDLPEVREFGDGRDALAQDPVAVVVLDVLDRLSILDGALAAAANGRGTGDTNPPWRVIFSHTAMASGGAIEVLHPTVSKAAPLRHLCHTLGISPAEVVAFGDNVNDVEMLQFAGMGVAMGNASLEARAAARLITGSHDEDGIAQVLEQLL